MQPSARRTTLITSASYVTEELSAEFGLLPPAFLPVGHDRLYDLQMAILENSVYLTVPQSFTLPDADAARLADLKVTVIQVPDGLSLGSSVLYALDVIGDTAQAVRILHGDTLISDLPEGDDVFAIAEAPEVYNWGAMRRSDDEAPRDPEDVLAGYFAFGDTTEFRRSLAIARGDFLAAVNRYASIRSVRLEKVFLWLDCGHLQTYYRSRCSMRIQRSFNELDMSFQVVEKRSSDSAKLDAEAAWFSAIPSRLRLYTPAFLGSTIDGNGYAIEYLPMPSLHELFVFGAVGGAGWRKILDATFSFMGAALASKGDGAPVIRDLTVDKTMARLDTWAEQSGISLDEGWRYGGLSMPSLRELARATEKLIDLGTSDMLGIMHGDLCFTNMFYDYRTQRIKVIDPRGSIDGHNWTPYGDLRYDMAKLNHSIAGAYDFILTGRFACSGFDGRDVTITFPHDSSFERVNELADEFDLNGRRLSDPEISAITIHLFLSMLPLHADNVGRQRAFVANALRLFSERVDR